MLFFRSVQDKQRMVGKEAKLTYGEQDKEEGYSSQDYNSKHKKVSERWRVLEYPYLIGPISKKEDKNSRNPPASQKGNTIFT